METYTALKPGNKMEIILAALAGLFLGSTIVLGIGAGKKEPPTEQVASIQQEVIKQLTNLDIVEPICSPEYIKEKGAGLCRELSCNIFTRGIDSQTSGQTCEAISNLNNTEAILDRCSTETSPEAVEKCTDLYLRRK